MKPILSCRNLIAVLITVGVLSFGTGVAKCETYGGGSGTAGDPYLIYTARQMNTIGLHSEDWNKHFKLMADVDLSCYMGAEFNVIGYYVNSSSNKPFTGIFEGDGYEIVNFTYSSTETNYIGLFGYVAGKNAEIKDLGLINPNIAAGRFVGALVGLLEDYGTVTRCYVKNGSISGAGFNVGGLVGFLGGYYRGGEGTISYCYSSGSVYGKNSVGGLVGRNENGMISNCYSSASVSGSDVCFGGLVGWNSYDGTIANCYSTGKVLGLYFAGGLVEENLGTVSNSFWDIQTSGLTHSAGGTGKTTAEMQMKSTFTSAGWDFIKPIWTIEDNDYPRLWWEGNILYVPSYYPTIQAAIDAAVDGDMVQVADGIYERAKISPIREFYKCKAITVRSENGPKNCIIDGNGEYGFWFYKTGTTPCRLEGFTLTNCQYDFGAIYCSEGSSPTITDCIMINNGNPIGVPHYRGIAGIRCYSRSSPTISNCVIVNNYFCAGNDSVGGGIFCKYSCNPTVKNCTIVSNTSCEKGGAIYCYSNCHIKITNCILWSNLPNEIFLEKESSAAIVCSDLQNGLESVYVEQGSTLDWGEGNIDADPLFVAPDSNDYHLLPASPCIDAGDPNYIAEPDETDLDGNPRIIGGRIDMGAYEFPDRFPVACIVGGDRTVEAGSDCEARVTLDGSCSSDEDSTPGTNDDINDFDWYEVIDPCDPNSDIFLGTGQIIECNLPLGEYIIILEVIDKADAFDANEVTITVEDTTPPEFDLAVEPNVLWPPNHKMVKITPSWTVSDNCDGSPEVALVSISSSEDNDSIGDGHTTDDIQIDSDGSIYLQAERSGKETGRIYTITYQAVDDSGNVTLKSATVSVPHDRRRSK